MFFNKWKENNCQFIIKKKTIINNAMHRNEGWQTPLVARKSHRYSLQKFKDKLA